MNEKLIRLAKDLIPGGLADNVKSGFDPDQLQKGIKVEMEHTNDPDLAREIAQDHLQEDPKYYDHLDEMESKYIEALYYASMFYKFAQDQDPQLNTPNITIQPGRPETSCALEILKRWRPDYFVGQ